MNHIYRVKWNSSKQTWQAVPEVGTQRGKSSRTQRSRGVGLARSVRWSGGALLTLLPVFSLLSANALAADLPTGGHVVAGTGQINQAGTTLTVNQGSNNLVIDWNSFNVGAGHTVNFVQPSAQAAVLNRVLGADVSVIQGAINANGKVFLVNPNGVLFTSSAQVNVGSMVASTLNMATDDFLNGNYRFEGASSNAIVNQGNITVVGDGNGGGAIALIAAKITNTGTLTATRGNVLVGAGQKVRLDLGGPVKIEVETAAVDALVEQGGAVRADGGLVYLTAKAAGELAATAINHTGITQAQTLQTGEKGQIYLMADMQNDHINVGGKLDASAPDGGDGGFIETSAAQVVAVQGRTVTTQAASGKTGTYLIDPNDFIIAANGGNITGAQLGADLILNDVLISTADATAGGNGDIFVNDAVAWGANKLTLLADRDININARLEGSGTAQLALFYGQAGESADNTAKITIAGSVGLPEGDNYSTQLGSDGAIVDYTVITRLGDPNDVITGALTLRGMAATVNATKNFALGANIDASATGASSDQAFTPIGQLAMPYAGKFDGLGNEISNLTVQLRSQYVGLFGRTTNAASISNVGVVNISTPQTTSTALVGGLVGAAVGTTVSNSYVTGRVTGGTYVGGLVGQALSGTKISNSYFAGQVTGGNRLGGLVGYNAGNIANSYATGQVESTVFQDIVGGLVGQNIGTISHNYSSASVHNHESQAPSTGKLVGSNTGIIFSNVWDTSAPSSSWLLASVGQSSGGGVGTNWGLDATAMKASANFSGWDFDNVWYAQDGYSAPLLRNFLKPLTISAKSVTKAYDGLAYTDPNGLIYSNPGSVDKTQLLGTVSYGVVSQAAPNASATPYDLTVSGLYSAQQGYIISYGSGGQLTVNKAVINLSASRAYNGSAVFDANLFGSSGVIEGVQGQTLGLTGFGTAATRNVVFSGDSYAQTLNETGLSLTSGTGDASNYTLTGGTHTASITPKALTITGTTVADKVYDGNRSATVAVGSYTVGEALGGDVLNGLVGGEVLTLAQLSGLFDSAEVGNRVVTVAYTLGNGEDATGPGSGGGYTLGEGQTYGLASNYTLASTTHNAKITALPVPSTVTPNPVTTVSIPQQAAINIASTLSASIFTPSGAIAPLGLNTDVSGPVQSDGLVFILVGNPRSGQNGLVPIFTVGSGVNFGDSASSP